MVSFTPRPPYPQGKRPHYPLDRRLGGPQSRSGRGEEGGNDILHEAITYNGVRVVNFVTSKNLIVKSATYTTTFINTLGLLLMVSHIIRSCFDRQKTTFKYIRCLIL
jgi:hypothetical protein